MLKRQRAEEISSSDIYIDTRFLAPGSNICAQFFSKAGYAVSDRRLAINPENLEEQLVLHVKGDCWNVMDAQIVVNQKANPQF